VFEPFFLAGRGLTERAVREEPYIDMALLLGFEAPRQGLQRQAAKPAKQAAGGRGGRPCGATARPCCFLPASRLQRKAR